MIGDRVLRTGDRSSLLHALYSRFFERIEVPKVWLDLVRDAAKRGPVVYVLRNLSFLDFMALDYITSSNGLPRIGFVNDLGLWLMEPFAPSWREALLGKRDETPEDRMCDAIRAGESVSLFLKRPPTLMEKATRLSRRTVSSDGDKLVKALFQLQREMDQPIMLVPQVFVWSKRPESVDTSVVDFFIGRREWPGRVRAAAQFLLNYDNVLFRAGEPISLHEFLSENQGKSEETLVRRGAYALLRKLERERRNVLGPTRKPADRVRLEIVRSPKLQAEIRRMAGEGKSERMLLTARAYSMLREMEAAPDPEGILALSKGFETFANMIYAGVEVDRDGLERVRQAAQQGTIVLLPSHKSHIDYLLLSHALYKESMQLPLIAAGENLSFFPAGNILRRGGAFFIRRSFRGDKLYTAVVNAYLRRVLRDGWPIEVFLEGTRSRTGKLLPPKLGLLYMIVESALSLYNKDVFLVPVSIGYERLVEEKSYVRELLGGEKHSEGNTALLRAMKVAAERYGRLNIQFGEIISLRDEARSLGLVPGKVAKRARYRTLTKRSAYRVMSHINAVTAATPGSMVATVLLSHTKRGLSHADLLKNVERLIVVLGRVGARTTASLTSPSGALRPGAISEAVDMFHSAGLIEVHKAGEQIVWSGSSKAEPPRHEEIIYQVPADKRLALDLSKNIIVHFFVPMALMSTALLMYPGPLLALHTLKERGYRLSQLFKHEFIYDADKSYDEVFETTVAALADAQVIEIDPDGMVGFGEGENGLDGRAWVVWYASMVRGFLESYIVAARGLKLLLRGAMNRKELIRKTLAVGDRMYLAREIERREALSSRSIDNALRAFKAAGYLQVVERKKVRLVSSFDDEQAVQAIASGLQVYLPRRRSDSK